MIMIPGVRLLWLSAHSRITLIWLWHTAFDGTRVCRCWRSVWIRDRRTNQQAERQIACGNCDLCLLPLDVLIMRGEITWRTT